MKLALVLAFCVALASARLPGFEEWGWNDDLESGPTTCQVSSRLVKTFDNVKLPISLPHCYTVLHKDCSSDPKFVILMRKLSPNSELKEIKILTRTHKIVLTPSQHQDNIRVKVNDQERPIMEDLELTVQGYPVIRITKLGQQQVKVECLKTGSKLRFDGRVCDIKDPEVSYKKQCGLCGLSNLELQSGRMSNEFLNSGFRTNDFLSNVFRTNEHVNTRDVRNLFIKYVTNDCRYTSESDYECTGYNCDSRRSSSLFWPESDNEMCNEIDCPYKQQSQRWLSDNLFQQSPRLYSDELFQQSPRLYSDELSQQSPRMYSDGIFDEDTTNDLFFGKHQYTTGKRPQLKHKIVERENQICVSLVRIPQCPVNSYPQQKIEKRIPYKCVSRSDPRVWKFETRIRHGEQIPEIQRLTPSLTRTEIIPIKCSPFY